uniref:Histone-lysine N-methyltransferase MLL5 n=1 Tax=Rhipicephalus appendiculatus TaxID=34631 RepID=A0A131Z051_RHIAP
MAAAAEELGSMSLALTQPRYPGDFLLASVEGGPAAMGAEEEASSVEPVASPPPPARSRNSHHNCFGLPYQDHNYGAPPPATPPQSPPPLPPPPPPPPLPPSPPAPPSPAQTRFNGTSPGLLVEVGSPPPLLVNGVVACDRKEECNAPSEESVTRCICGFNQDDEYMICCDQCLVWQHVDCMGLDRSHIPETYLCERCCPRRVDRQRARSLQTRKKHQMARLLSRLESASEDVDAAKNVECSTAVKRGSRVVRRKRQRSESSPEALPPAVHKKAMKEKIERKRVKLKGMVKRAGRRLAPSAEEEEAAVGDPWRGGSGGSEGPPSYEQASANQYSPEVQLLASSLQTKGGVEKEELLQVLAQDGWEGAWQLDECVSRGRQGRHRLLTTRAVSAEQPLLEVRGKFLSASQFRLQNPVFQKRLYPCVLFYKGWAGDEDGVCVDARIYGNEARFVRRSCRPTARVVHTLQGGLLRLYLVAERDLAPAEEITIPFDFDYRHCIHRVTCACGQDDCRLHQRKPGTVTSPMERKRRGRRSSSSQVETEVKEEVAAVHEEDVTSSGPSLDDRPPPPTVTDASSNEHQEGSPPLASPDSAGHGVSAAGDDVDGELPNSGHSNRRRKMTREERKIDAIMRAFEKMERTEKRRQLALERLQHRGGRPSTDEGRPEVDERSNEETPALETDPASLPPEDTERTRSLRVVSRKSSSSKRRRSTQSRRTRTRSNSGGPELLLAAAATVGGLECPEGVSFPPPASSPEEEEPSSPPPTELSPQPGSSPPGQPPPLPKSKRFLMQGWLHEKRHEGAGPSSGDGPPVYVRCTRDTGSAGISAAHLRRHSGSAGSACNAAGSAKKRWLRQAMFETSEDVPDEGEGVELPVSPMLEDSISPPPADLVTPLKKRRLMRNSLDSVGGLSPATGEAAATLLSFQTPLLLHHHYQPEEEEPQPQSQSLQQQEEVQESSQPALQEAVGSSPLVDDPPTPLDDEGSVDWEEGPSPPAALGPRLLPPLTSGQPSPLELAGRTLEGRPPSAPRLPEPLPGPHDEDEAPKQSVQVEPEVRPSWGTEASDSSSSSPSVRGGKRKVSLSEYRQRMRDTARPPAAVVPASMVPDSPVKHSSLGQPHDVPADARAVDDDESWPQRERLSQRLRREFGLLDDDSDTERGTTASGPEDALLPLAPPHMYGGYLPPPLQVLPFGTPLQTLDSAPASVPASHRPGYFPHN